MVMIKRVLALLGSGTLAILLLRQAETAAQAVRDGIQLCLTSVIPALFPFFAVSSLLVALGAAEAAGRALARPFGRLFRCGGAGCAALLLGLVLLVPALEPLFAIAPLSVGMVGAIVGLAFGSMLVIQLLKWIRR